MHAVLRWEHPHNGRRGEHIAEEGDQYPVDIVIGTLIFGFFTTPAAAEAFFTSNE